MSTITNCPVCNGIKTRGWGQKLEYDFYICRDCGYVFTTVSNSDESKLTDLYDHYYDGARFEIDAVVSQSLARLVESAKHLCQTGRWLDIGYGEGALLKTAQAQGWNCFGTEISPRAIEYGASQGWVVASQPQTDRRFPRQGFDVVTMIEVLEHVTDPKAVLQAAAQWVRPGGGLYITTPNATSLNRYALGLDWSIFCPPEHVSIWSVKSLARALEENGFHTSRIRTEGFNPGEILARRAAKKAESEPLSRNQMGMALNETFSRNRFRRAIKSVVNQGLSLCRLGDTLKVWAIRNEGF